MRSLPGGRSALMASSKEAEAVGPDNAVLTRAHIWTGTVGLPILLSLCAALQLGRAARFSLSFFVGTIDFFSANTAKQCICVYVCVCEMMCI